MPVHPEYLRTISHARKLVTALNAPGRGKTGEARAQAVSDILAALDSLEPKTEEEKAASKSTYNTGVRLLKQGRPKDAIPWLAVTVLANDKLEWAHYYLSEAYSKTGDREKAMKHMRRYVALILEQHPDLPLSDLARKALLDYP